MSFHLYNTDLYNTAQYNADTTAFYQPLTDTVTSSDVLLKSPMKVLVDTETLTDNTLAKMPQPNLVDNLFVDEIFSKQVKNKGLSDTIRIEEWTTVKRKPGSIPWGD